MAEPIAAVALVADPAAAVIVAWVGLAYAFGLRRWRAAAGRWPVGSVRGAVFGAGLLVVAVALDSPLDGATSRSLTAHMVQHVLLLSVAAPLLALGLPFPTLAWALPARARTWALPAGRRLSAAHHRHPGAWIGAALMAQAVAMWVWHAPAFYDASLANPALHALEHSCFLLSATWASWAVVTVRRTRRGAAALAGFVGSLPGMALGAAMVLAPRPWYPPYVHELSPALRDQQVAGVVMWAFGGMLAVVVGAGLFVSWLAHDDAAEGPEHFTVPPLRRPDTALSR